MALRIRAGSFAGTFLSYLFAAEDLLIDMIAQPYLWRQPPFNNKWKENRSVIYRLINAGLIEVVEDQGKKYYKLTKTGEMQALVLKTRMPIKTKWDGKWRIIIFDIPEGASNERDQLRRLLLLNNYQKLQASVYISPYPINREAIDYLKETGLIKYIRFARIDELDDDKDLKKKFDL
jgi:DNA-binding transcriptional regulator PaaX